MADEDQVTEATPEEISEAKGMGWADEPDFRGDKAHWVDAKTFLERGRVILPIVSKRNKELTETTARQQEEIRSLADSLKAAQAAITALEQSHDEDVKEQVAAAKEELKHQLAAAYEANDHTAIADLTEKMVDLKAAEKAPVEKVETKTVTQSGRDELTPEFVAWRDENKSWWGKDKRKTRAAILIAEELRSDPVNSHLTGNTFFDKVSAQLDEEYGTRGESKVLSGNGGGGRTNTGEKTFADLPAEAKEACNSLVKKLVGPNRAHKNVESWRKSYVEQYFQE